MKRSLAGLIVLLILIAAGLFIWFGRNWIFDEIRLYHYTPPPTVVQLANQDTMTPYAKHLFYVYHPDIEGKAGFNNDCKVTEQAIVLGCTVIGRGIWMYDVQAPELNGVEQVTAAHEMLHVAYSRLSSSERAKVDAMVWSAYNQISKTNTVVRNEEQSYLKTEGAAAVPNELHSVLGTEVASLPTDLENYYKQYFTNRQAIINYSNSYQNAFLSRQQEITTDNQQLATMQKQINADEASLNVQDQQLSQEQAELNSLKNSGQVTAFNSLVDQYNQSVNSHNSLVVTVRQLINSYNQLVTQVNAIATSENQLAQDISSTPSTVSAQ